MLKKLAPLSTIQCLQKLLGGTAKKGSFYLSFLFLSRSGQYSVQLMSVASLYIKRKAFVCSGLGKRNFSYWHKKGKFRERTEGCVAWRSHSDEFFNNLFQRKAWNVQVLPFYHCPSQTVLDGLILFSQVHIYVVHTEYQIIPMVDFGRRIIFSVSLNALLFL